MKQLTYTRQQGFVNVIYVKTGFLHPVIIKHRIFYNADIVLTVAGIKKFPYTITHINMIIYSRSVRESCVILEYMYVQFKFVNQDTFTLLNLFHYHFRNSNTDSISY